ncbi:MAG: ABC transporter ATP-binding protein/permease [Lachnospiraceae bacterium]|nr:ABC transporter ATP-binding protein/permease [Lachnospiraceae bacterium]
MEEVRKSYENITAGQVLRTLAGYIKQFKFASVMTPIFMVVEVLMETIIPYLMADIIDNGVAAGNMGHIYRVGALMTAFALVSLTAGLCAAVFAAKASAGLAMNLRNAMYRNIQKFSFSNIDRFSTSGLITRLTTDVTNVQNAYQMLLRMCMRAPVSLICAMIMSFVISARLACVYLVAVIFLTVFLCTIVPKVTKYFARVFEKYDDLNESVEENVSAIRVVKAFVREDTENEKFKKAVTNLYGMFVKAEKMIIANMPVMQFTVYACILSISWIGANMIVYGSLSTGQLMSMLTYCMNILMNLMMLSIIFVMMTMSAASAKRITEVIIEDSDLKDPKDPVTEVKDGSIIFENVSFGYNKTAEEPVLKNIDLKIGSGQIIGIIGGTGSAKTSLVNLICRLYDVDSGSVKVGGIDVRDYSMEVLRDKVAIVLQQNNIFSGTILENLRWGNENADLEDCRRVCRMASADEFIENFPDGYNTRIEQGGTNVSGGQRQRLCIARALLKNPKIVIFDDSTSAVDTATDAAIRKEMRRYIPDTTKIIISQRISSIRDADRIIVMDDGRISGYGTHEELLKNNEIYRDICESQISGLGDFDKPV